MQLETWTLDCEKWNSSIAATCSPILFWLTRCCQKKFILEYRRSPAKNFLSFALHTDTFSSTARYTDNETSKGIGVPLRLSACGQIYRRKTLINVIKDMWPAHFALIHPAQVLFSLTVQHSCLGLQLPTLYWWREIRSVSFACFFVIAFLFLDRSMCPKYNSDAFASHSSSEFYNFIWKNTIWQSSMTPETRNEVSVYRGTLEENISIEFHYRKLQVIPIETECSSKNRNLCFPIVFRSKLRNFHPRSEDYKRFRRVVLFEWNYKIQ